MKNLCFYFQVHQPFRLRNYRFFDIGRNYSYYDEEKNRSVMEKVAAKCYLPANRTLLDLIKRNEGRFKISFSISGTALEQFELYAPAVLESFKELAATGCVSFLSETYAHSLSSLVSEREFVSQVKQHARLIARHFEQSPKVFRNTELIYSDRIAEMVSGMGYRAMLAEGADHILGWRSPNFLYSSAPAPQLKLLLKNYRLSDDIAFRFSEKSWNGWPLSAEKFVDWLNGLSEDDEIVNLFMDYETFGEHQWEESGIFAFLRALPETVLSSSPFKFVTVDEAAAQLQPRSVLSMPDPVSWADEERDLSAWLGNNIQDDAFESLYRLENKIRQCDDPELIRDWRYLQTSDHFYYMCTKFFADGDVHKYFNPYNSPFEAFLNYMNVLSDFEGRLDEFIQKRDNRQLALSVIKKKTAPIYIFRQFQLADYN